MARSNKPGGVWMLIHKEGRKRLARLMIVQDVSHRELAQIAGWKSHTMIHQLINGQRNSCKAEPATAIARYLGVEVTDIFTPTLSSNPQQPKRGVAA